MPWNKRLFFFHELVWVGRHGVSQINMISGKGRITRRVAMMKNEYEAHSVAFSFKFTSTVVVLSRDAAAQYIVWVHSAPQIRCSKYKGPQTDIRVTQKSYHCCKRHRNVRVNMSEKCTLNPLRKEEENVLWVSHIRLPYRRVYRQTHSHSY